MECHDKCTMERGCTGPGSFIGPGGCNFCEVVKLMEETFTENNTKGLWVSASFILLLVLCFSFDIFFITSLCFLHFHNY